MFQHTIRAAAYQQSSKKPGWSLNVMTWRQAVESTVEWRSNLLQGEIMHIHVCAVHVTMLSKSTITMNVEVNYYK